MNDFHRKRCQDITEENHSSFGLELVAAKIDRPGSVEMWLTLNTTSVRQTRPWPLRDCRHPRKVVFSHLKKCKKIWLAAGSLCSHSWFRVSILLMESRVALSIELVEPYWSKCAVNSIRSPPLSAHYYLISEWYIVPLWRDHCVKPISHPYSLSTCAVLVENNMWSVLG